MRSRGSPDARRSTARTIGMRRPGSSLDELAVAVAFAPCRCFVDLMTGGEKFWSLAARPISARRAMSMIPYFKECPQGGKAFFVELDKEGRVANVAPIVDREVRTRLRKYEKAAGYLFPSFNVPPLLQFQNDSDTQRAADRRAFPTRATHGIRDREDEF